MCKALIRPFKQSWEVQVVTWCKRGNSSWCVLRLLGDFQFSQDLGPHGREGSWFPQQPQLLLSDLTQRESLTTHTPFVKKSST